MRFEATDRVWRYWLLAALTVILAFGLRLYRLDYEGLFMDEVHQASCYGLKFSEVAGCALDMAQPPLDYWIGHFVYQFADSDFAVRLPALMFGTASVALLLLLLRGNAAPAIVITVSLLYAVSVFHLYYSQEARPYAIAIFLFLLLHYQVVRCISMEKLGLIAYLGILLTSYLFLMSRTFAPLCIIASYGFIVGIRVIAKLRMGQFGAAKPGLAMLSAFALAGLLFLPTLSLLSQSAQRYAPASGLAEMLAIGIRRFDLTELWESYLTQNEPLGYLFLPLLFYALFANLRAFFRGERGLYPMTAVLCVLSLSLQVFLYKAKTDYPLRVPYLINVQPLTLILIADALGRLWQTPFKHRAAMFSALSAIALLMTANSLHDTWQTPKREDWRGLANVTKTQLGASDLVIGDTLSIRPTWKPYLYGLMRYAPGSANFVEMPTLLQADLTGLEALPLTPHLALFYYRDIKLTRHSAVAIMKNAGGLPDITGDRIKPDPALQITHLNAMIFASLTTPDGGLLPSTYRLIYHVVKALPHNESLVDLLTLAAEIEALCPNAKMADFQPWQQALGLAKAQDMPYLEQAKAKLNAYAETAGKRQGQCGKP